MDATKFLNYISLFTSIILLQIAFFFFTSDGSNIIYPKYGSHKILYVDPQFNDYEIMTIRQAASEWELKTNHIVKYAIVVMDYETKVDFKNGIVINKISEFNVEVMDCDKGHPGKYTLGYFSTEGVVPHIGIIYDRIIQKTLKTIVMHELGHSLGLKHNEKDEDMETLMYPTIDLGSSEITEKDLKNFCKIYKC